MRVYVLLYNAGTDNEGIHTLQMKDQDFVLMFESEDDAIRYALLLEAQDFPVPSVESIDSEEVEEFCQSASYQTKYVSEGMLEVPPENNVEQTDWDINGKPQAPLTSESSPADMSAFELERIRRQLENLL